MRVVAIAVAGAAGALARYGIGLAMGVRTFPWATLLINVAGSFALGWLLGGPAERWSETTRLAIGVGFLGAFTTFSTFAYETTALVRDDRLLAAGAYVAASLVLGLAASAAGFVIARGWST